MSENGFVDVINALPTSKLITTISAGIGKLYEPTHIKRMARAKAEEIKLISGAMEECSVIPTQYNDGSLSLNNTDWDDFIRRTQGRMAFQELQKQNNIESVVANAYNILENEQICSEEPVEQGWVSRFFNSVADVSDEDLQKLWGKVLAGEVKPPRSYSLRTLETLKNLSKYEAELFQKLLPYVIETSGGPVFLSANKDIQKKFNIIDGAYIQLDFCGLLKMIPFTQINISINPLKTERQFFTKNRLLSLTNLTPKEQCFVAKEIYLLTNAGKELFDLFKNDSNGEYFDEWVKIAYKSNKNLLFTVHENAEDNSQAYKAEALFKLGG